MLWFSLTLMILLVEFVKLNQHLFPTQILHSHWDITITSEELQNLDLCLALFSFEGGGGIKCATTFWTQALGLAVPSGGPRPRPNYVISYGNQGATRTYNKVRSRSTQDLYKVRLWGTLSGLFLKCVQFLVFFST